MNDSFFALMLQFYPKISEYEELQSTYVANCIFNSFLCHTAIMLNIVTINALRRISSLPKTLKTLLLSLAVSDVGIGSLGQPLYILLLVMWLQQNCLGRNTDKSFLIVLALFSLASFFGVVALSLDRFLAIHLHLRYQELVTHKRVVAEVILIWVLSVFLSLMVLWLPFDVSGLFMLIVGVLGLLVIVGVYVRIYLVARRHKNQIAPRSTTIFTNEGNSKCRQLVSLSLHLVYYRISFVFKLLFAFLYWYG